MTSLISWRKKYSFLKPTYLDDVDRVFAGDVFQVQYLGYNKLNAHAEGTAREILSRYSVQRRNKIANQKLIIDSRSIALHEDSPDQALVLFNIPLSSVKNVIYRKRDKLYGNYCAFTVRDDAERCEGVHVMSCDSPDEISRIIQSFETVFSIGSEH